MWFWYLLGILGCLLIFVWIFLRRKTQLLQLFMGIIVLEVILYVVFQGQVQALNAIQTRHIVALNCLLFMVIAGQDFFLTNLRPAVLTVLVVVVVWLGYKVFAFDPAAAEAERIREEIERQHRQVEIKDNWSEIAEKELKLNWWARYSPGWALEIISVQGGELEYYWDRDKNGKRWLVKPEQFLPASQDTVFVRAKNTVSSDVVKYKIRYIKIDTNLSLKGKDF